MEKEILGIVMRYSDDIMLDKKINTIDEHNKIIIKKGMVYLGKLGRFIGKSNIKQFNNKMIDRYLILVKKEDREYIFYIVLINSVYIKIEKKAFVPKYYREKAGISTWFCLKEPILQMSNDDISKWIIKSSKFSLRDTLSKSMAGFFVVTKGKAVVKNVDKFKQKKDRKKDRFKAKSDEIILDDKLLLENAFFDDDFDDT